MVAGLRQNIESTFYINVIFVKVLKRSELIPAGFFKNLFVPAASKLYETIFEETVREPRSKNCFFFFR